MFNIVQFFENLFGFGKPAPTPAPSVLQDAINTAGSVLDGVENIVNTLQGVAPVLPAAFQGYVAALAVALHGLDAYVDTLEAAPPTPVPVQAPTPPATPPPA